jgi:hypothetical protein
MSPQDFYRKYPPDRFMAALESRRRPVLPWLAALAGTVAAATAAFVLLSPPPPATQPPPFGAVGTTTLKGAEGIDRPLPDSVPVLRVEVRRADRFAPLAPDGTVHPGDVIRLLYDATDFDYLCVVSIDGRGHVDTWYPDGDGRSIPIVRGRNIPLQGAIALDDYLGPERLIALFSTAPLDAGTVEEEVRKAMARSELGGKDATTARDWVSAVRDIPSLSLPARVSTVLLERRTP